MNNQGTGESTINSTATLMRTVLIDLNRLSHCLYPQYIHYANDTLPEKTPRCHAPAKSTNTWANPQFNNTLREFSGQTTPSRNQYHNDT